MEDNIKKTIFNPSDKLSERTDKKFYLEFIPYDKSNDARKNGFKFDPDNKKWYTLDESHHLLNKYKKSFIDFNRFKKENSIFFDTETKQWYTYTGNDYFKNYI